MPIYDDFSAPELDANLWTPVVPGGGLGTGALTIQLDRGECCICLTSGNSQPEPADASAKLQTVLLSTRTWLVGRDPMVFSTTLAAEADESGPAGAAFGIFDAEGGTVIGLAMTGQRILAVARESGDPLAPLATGALEFGDLAVATDPMRRHDVKIEYDPQRRIARWYIDEVMRLYREVPFDPRELTCAFGLLPLQSVDAGAPAPAIKAAWGPIQYQDESELEPDPFYSAMPG